MLETASGAVEHHLNAAAIDPRKLYYLPEAGLLFVADGTDLTIRDLAAGEADAILDHSRPLVDFSLSSDGRQILTQDDVGALRLWHLETAAELLARIEALDLPRALTCVERAEYLVLPLCE